MEILINYSRIENSTCKENENVHIVYTKNKIETNYFFAKIFCTYIFRMRRTSFDLTKSDNAGGQEIDSFLSSFLK